MNNKWVMHSPTKTKIIFKAECITLLLKYRQIESDMTESGGVLIGRHILEQNVIAVDNISTPYQKDTRSRYSFFRSKNHNKYLKKIWEESSYTQGHLGLWHTHPEDFPTPSSIDISDWKKAIKKDTYEGNMLIFIIVGLKSIRCWIGYQNEITFSMISDYHIL